MSKNTKLTILILNAVALAMGISSITLCIITSGTIKNLISMIAIGVTCLALAQIIKLTAKNDNK